MSNTKTNLYGEEPDLVDMMDYQKNDTMLSLNCHSIGTIEDFDSSNQTCTVKISYKKTFYRKQDDGSFKNVRVDYPLLLQCPLIMVYGGLAGLTMPVRSGDSCVVLFNDRDIDNWFGGVEGGLLNSNRLHSLSDGLILTGIKNTKTALSSYDTDNPVLYNGDTHIKVKSDKVLIENNSEQLGALLVELIDAVKAIVTVGSAATQTVDGASQTALNAIATRLEGLLE